jgi:hypothetical protein
LKRTRSKRNELISFLEGIWTTTNITITPNKEVEITEYREVMKRKNNETITITALGINKGKDVTREMTLKLHGDKVTLSQRDFCAEGIKKGNLVSLTGTYHSQMFDFRLYLMEDKYIYQKDVWEKNRIVEIQMSYLLRSASSEKNGKYRKY